MKTQVVIATPFGVATASASASASVDDGVFVVAVNARVSSDGQEKFCPLVVVRSQGEHH